jgi:hypothetical protein
VVYSEVDKLFVVLTKEALLKPTNPVRLSISLRADQYDALESLSRRTGAPMAELLRRAIDRYAAARNRSIANSARTNDEAENDRRQNAAQLTNGGE